MPNFTVVTLKCGLTAPKIGEIGNFWYKFDQNGYTPLSYFFIQNMAWEREPQVCTLMPNFTIVGKKKCVPTAPNGIFWYKFAKMGISPGNWTFRSQDHSLPGAKVPGVELSLPGTFAPWTFRSLELSLPGTFAPTNKCSKER